MGSSVEPMPIPPGLEPAYRSLLKDMRLALLSEIGARSIYDHLGRRAPQDELQRLLRQLNVEGAESVAVLRDLMLGMGGRPRRTSRRRRLLARMLAWLSVVIGRRIVLRVCLNAEQTVARWYGEYALFLTRLDDTARARTCEELRSVKLLHAGALEAWIGHMGRR